MTVRFTEDQIARAFVDEHLDTLRYDHTADCWYVWGGTCRQRDATRAVYDMVRLFCRQRGEHREDNTAEVRQLGRHATAKSVERMASADQRIAAKADTWDQDPWLLGTPDGTINLQSCTLRPASPGDFITRLTSVGPAGDIAGCPTWLRFLQEATGNDVELQRYLQDFAGYTLTGNIREHALLFVCGQGGNGKSVFQNTLARVLGSYATTASMDTFISSAMDRHTTELAMLRGARLVTASETEENRSWAESRIKQLTGGDDITARFMRQDNFTYRPEFKLVIIGNHKPSLRNVDAAMERRFNIVPFDRTPEVVDRDLETKLQAEFGAILRWMLDGCLRWQKQGLVRPPVIVEATTAYLSDQDLVRQWLEQDCDCDPTFSDTTANLFQSWSRFASEYGENAQSLSWLARRLSPMGFKPRKSVPPFGKRGFAGVRVRSDHGEVADRADQAAQSVSRTSARGARAND